MVYYRN